MQLHPDQSVLLQLTPYEGSPDVADLRNKIRNIVVLVSAFGCFDTAQQVAS